LDSILRPDWYPTLVPNKYEKRKKEAPYYDLAQLIGKT
jgi:hypothetical protein